VHSILSCVFSWVLRNYESADPIILSVDGTYSEPELSVARCIVAISRCAHTESAEVTIKDVVEAIAGAMDFKGKIVVGYASYVFVRAVHILYDVPVCRSTIRPRLMVNIRKLLATPNCASTCLISSSLRFMMVRNAFLRVPADLLGVANCSIVSDCIDAGIKRSVQWFLDNYEIARK